MNVILNSQEFSFNSWNPFLPVLQYKGTFPLADFHLAFTVSEHRLSLVTHGGTYTQWSILCRQFSDLEIEMRRWRGGSKCFESLGKANQDRNWTLQRAHAVLWPQPFVPGTRGKHCQRDGAGKDSSEGPERLQRQARNSTLGKSRTFCYQAAACPVPGPGGHTTFHHSRATLCIWHQELTLEP